MAKQTVSKKHTQISHLQGKGIQQEHTEVFDDNLLPESKEIEALYTMDNSILEWLKLRAEKEQDFRHVAYTKKMDTLGTSLKKDFQINVIGIVFAFLIMIVGMGLSGFLIYTNNVTTGSIFGGVTILYAAALFLNKTKEPTKLPTQ